MIINYDDEELLIVMTLRSKIMYFKELPVP